MVFSFYFVPFSSFFPSLISAVAKSMPTVLLRMVWP